MHNEFRETLAELRKNTARFRRVAFHMHSPDSRDWAEKNADPVRNDRQRFYANSGWKLFVDELRDHLDCVCITDHMRCTFASLLSRRSKHPIILPGMEVNLEVTPIGFSRIHILSIFPEASTPESFARLFSDQTHIPPEDSKRDGQEVVKNLSLEQWV